MPRTVYLYTCNNPRSVRPREEFLATAKELKARKILGSEDEYGGATYRMHLTLKYGYRDLPFDQVRSAIYNHYDTHGCWCQHDCCGCTIAMSYKVRQVGRGRYTFLLSYSRNY